MKKTAHALTIVSILAVAFNSNAQVTLTGNNYTQNFDGIAAGLPPGWSVRTGASATSLGGTASFVASTNSWGTSTGQFSNQSSTTNNDGAPFTGGEAPAVQSGCTNRCPAVRQTSSFGDPGAAFVFEIKDTAAFGSFLLTLDFNLLNEQNHSTTWTVDYGLGSAPTSFIAVGTFTDPGAFGTTTKSFSFGSALDGQNQNVWIRIVALAQSSGSSGSRDTFGIDNFALSFGPYVASTNPPAISAQPQGTTNNATVTAVFTVAADGAPPLSYQWRKNGDSLADADNISGATTPSLTVSNALAADAGIYTVAVSNRFGLLLSSNAVLAVLDPIITTPPAGRTNLAGDTAVFSTTAAGTATLKYQWRFNGADIPGATANSLTVTNVQATNQGNFSVIVSNSSGVVTSAVASLTLLPTPAARLARWDFNATNALSVTAPVASSGSGAAALVGGTTATFSAGSGSDAAGASGAANSGWNISAFPTQGSGNKSAGAQFNVSTLGHKNILLTWEERHSNTASKYARLQYTTDGTTFTDANVITMTATNNSFVFYSSDLSGVPGVNNNPNFAFRVVTEFENSATGAGTAGFAPTVATSSYSTAGTLRFDLVNVFGDPLAPVVSPIPLKIQLVGTKAVLSWSDPAFALQCAPQAQGVYTNISGATSPYTNAAAGSQLFFRLKAN